MARATATGQDGAGFLAENGRVLERAVGIRQFVKFGNQSPWRRCNATCRGPVGNSSDLMPVTAFRQARYQFGQRQFAFATNNAIQRGRHRQHFGIAQARIMSARTEMTIDTVVPEVRSQCGKLRQIILKDQRVESDMKAIQQDKCLVRSEWRLDKA